MDPLPTTFALIVGILLACTMATLVGLTVPAIVLVYLLTPPGPASQAGTPTRSSVTATEKPTTFND